MIGGLIAVIVLVGVLAHVGGRVEKTAAPEEAPSSIGVADGDGVSGFACDAKGPHRRDLTIPRTNRSMSAPMKPKTCDD